MAKFPMIYGGNGATLITKNITQNGTYNAQDDNADGYSQVSVNVSGGGGAPYFFNNGDYITISSITGSMVYGADIQYTQVFTDGQYRNLWSLGNDNFCAYNDNTAMTRHTVRVRRTVYGATHDINAINHLIIKDGTINYNNTQIGTYTAGTPLSTNSSAQLKLFCNNNNSSKAGGVFLFSFKLYDVNGDLLIDLVPEQGQGNISGRLFDNVSQSYISSSAGNPLYGQCIQ